jgi:ectoine hydroxylase-related dioxygenase (phytanoyl-CoA dioxygenase family)
MLGRSDITALDSRGYVVLPQALAPDHVARLRRAFDTQPPSHGTQHIVVTEATPEHASWRALERHPSVLAAAAHVLGREFLVRDSHGRNPLPGFGQQGLHADWKPRRATEPFYVVTALFMLDDFTVENGATRVVPGSDRLAQPVPKSVGQPLAHHPEEVVVTGSAGSVLVFNGHLWHSGRRNTGRGPRRAVQMIITAADVAAREYFASSP